MSRHLPEASARRGSAPHSPASPGRAAAPMRPRLRTGASPTSPTQSTQRACPARSRLLLLRACHLVPRDRGADSPLDLGHSVLCARLEALPLHDHSVPPDLDRLVRPHTLVLRHVVEASRLETQPIARHDDHVASKLDVLALAQEVALVALHGPLASRLVDPDRDLLHVGLARGLEDLPVVRVELPAPSTTVLLLQMHFLDALVGLARAGLLGLCLGAPRPGQEHACHDTQEDDHARYDDERDSTHMQFRYHHRSTGNSSEQTRMLPDPRFGQRPAGQALRALRSSSSASRTAPAPPARRDTQWAAFRTSGAALAGARASPARLMGGRSGRSSPIMATSAGSSPSRLIRPVRTASLSRIP